ncbi:MAG: trypsin-like peptidase domain-containing protein [Acidobacteria bacterium]|nr:trypsin-like peptidase domain-containing protein [Acidobacteriota bacterium]
MTLLSPAEFEEIRDLAAEARLSTPGIREQLLDGIDPNALGFININNPPAIQLRVDFRWVADHERLADGSIPLLTWLKNAASLTKSFQQGPDFRRWADIVSSRAAGEPLLSLPPSDSPALKFGDTTLPLPELKEAVLFENTIIPYSFLAAGAIVGRSVARVSIPVFESGAPVLAAGGAQSTFNGTGWVLSGDYIITNHHVVNARAQGLPPASAADFDKQGANATIRFDYDDGNAAGESFSATAVVAADAKLDYAILHTAAAHNRLPLRRLAAQFDKTRDNIPVNIIQHPDGGPKMIAIRNNLVTQTTNDDVCYLTDTKFGSSGSPVFNDEWSVVALHRGSVLAENVKYFNKSTLYVNIGTQIASILNHLRSNFPSVLAAIG